MGWDFLILGSRGAQGKIVTHALLEKGYNLFLSDIHSQEIDGLMKKNSQQVGFQVLDVSEIEKTKDLIDRIKPKVVINCAEGDSNLKVYQACLAVGIDVIDLGSDTEQTKKQLQLHREFEKTRIIGITGCGSTPGINNVMLKYASHKFDQIISVEAGFAWDSNKKVFIPPFSTGSIVYELFRPAPYVKNGKLKNIEKPLKKTEWRTFRKIGSHKCFIVDHPETYTFEHCFKNKGIKNVRFYASFPSHSLETIKMLEKLGLCNEKDVSVEYEKDKNKDMIFYDISPLDFLTRALERIEPPSGYKETEVLWVSISGKKDGRSLEIEMECFVPPLKGWEKYGCNIDTGFPAAIIAQMIKRKEIDKYGSFVPEQIIPEKSFFDHLSRYGMKVFENGSIIN